MKTLKNITFIVCGVFLIFLIFILVFHKGSLQSIRTIINANSAVRSKYGGTSKLTCRIVGIYKNPGTSDIIYFVHFEYGNHHGIVEEEYGNQNLKFLQIKEN